MKNKENTLIPNNPEDLKEVAVNPLANVFLPHLIVDAGFTSFLHYNKIFKFINYFFFLYFLCFFFFLHFTFWILFWICKHIDRFKRNKHNRVFWVFSLLQ